MAVEQHEREQIANILTLVGNADKKATCPACGGTEVKRDNRNQHQEKKTSMNKQITGISTQQSEWRWFGNAGHYVCGRWCRFHLTTQVGQYLVSTIGEYVHPRHSKGSEQAEAAWLNKNWPGEDIGSGRKYETMVFLAGKPCDAPECGCGLPQIDGNCLDFAGYNNAKDATEGHMKMCEIWAQ